MKLETFFEKFDSFADAPDAVAKMRELVLGLAVQGKLVPQDNSNESAEPLLKCAAMQAQKLPIATKYQRLAKEAEEHLASRELQSLPRGWVWTCSAVSGATAPRVDVDDDALVAFAPMNLLPTDYRSTFEPEVRPWREIKKGYTHFANGDVGFAKITPCFQNGKGCVFKNLPGGAGSGTTELHILRPFNGVVLPLYALLFYKSPEFVAGGVASFSGTAGQQRVSNDYFRFAPFPLPPLAEQKRIVAKVDELMALCDRLEAQQQERETRHAALARASLARIADAPTPANLNFIFHKSYDIPPPDLRDTIISMAYRGELVVNHPEDGTGSDLLQFISTLHPPTQRFGGRRKGEPVRDPLKCAGLYDVPKHWAWSFLDFLCESIADVDHNMPKAVEVGVPFLSAKDLKDDGTLDFSSPKYISEEDFERLSRKVKIRRDDIIYSRIGARLGKARLVEVDTRFLISYSCCLVRPMHDAVDKRYLQTFLDSKLAIGQAHKGAQSIGVPDLGLGEIKAFRIPLPPLAEQRRIVAKVEQLMAMVVALETQLAASRATAADLLSAVVAELTGA